MKITVDTNILVRMIVRDDPTQGPIALQILETAEEVLIPLPCLCEFAWVLRKTYNLPRDRIASSIRAIIGRSNVSTEIASVTTGLRLLDAGGDFADGAIAGAGNTMGGEVFVSFDRKAVARVNAIGIAAEQAAPLP